MIYQTNFFEKEFRNAYTQQSFSRKRQFSIGVFLGLLTFAVYFCLQTLSKSVLVDAFPYVMMPSYFSTLYIYLQVSLLFNAIFFIVNYEYMSYVEIMRNRWYPLVQLGYHPLRLIWTKLAVRILSQVYIYSIGFLMTIFVSSFFKFPFVSSYILSLYIVGFLDMLLLSTVSLAASLYFKNTVNARYIVGMIGVSIFVGKIASGFAKIVSDRARMATLENLFDFSESVYLITAGLLIVACVLICVIRGSQLARVYNQPMLRDLPELTQKPHGTVILKQSTKQKKLNPNHVVASVDKVQRKEPFSLPSFVTTVALIVSIVAMLGVNALVLACGYASPEKETSILGMIPYVFQSSTMEPTIMYNDLAFFRKIDYQEKINVGDILLFKDPADTPQVARFKEYAMEEDGTLSDRLMMMDIDHYVDERYKGVALQETDRSRVYGVFSSANRWLGAIILFASTTLGRIILLLIPTFLVFFYDPITKFFRALSSERESIGPPTSKSKSDKVSRSV